MGHINFPLLDFYDGASELVGIKSGILLNRFKISEFLLEKHDDQFLLSDDMHSFIRIGADTMTNMVVHLRQRIGNLPAKLSVMADYQILQQYMFKTKDMTISGVPSEALHWLKESKGKDMDEVKRILMREAEIDDILARAALNIALYMEDTDITISRKARWDETTSLSDLFEMETKPKKESEFIEQKFIDYLATNGHEIESIHWRNFERFCAEYFKRLGYYVVLGPGSNDGGVDIRVYPDKENLSASLILIQCKRYAGDHKVTIETVKSFYTDILFEGAKEGIIATTGYIAKGGKKVVEARKYNVSFSEKEKIKKWAVQMKSI